MSCNPAIGGIAKGHLVREIDALGGIMGLVADACGIQFRLLNTSRGPAVWSPRAQCDKALYRVRMRELLESIPNLHLKQAEVVDVLLEEAAEPAFGRETPMGPPRRVTGLLLRDGRRSTPTPPSSPPAPSSTGSSTAASSSTPPAGPASPPACCWANRSSGSACASSATRPARPRGSTAAPSTGPAFRSSPATRFPPRSPCAPAPAAAPDLLPHRSNHARNHAADPRKRASLAHVFRPDPVGRPALLPVHRRQDRSLPGQGLAPVLP